MVKYISKSLKRKRYRKNKGGAFFPSQETATMNKSNENEEKENAPSSIDDNIKPITSTPTSSTGWFSWFFGNKPTDSSSPDSVTTNNQNERSGGRTIKKKSLKKGKSIKRKMRK